MKKMKADKNIYIFLAVTILILWQMLLPGYILTLDMVFGPETFVAFLSDDFRNFLPLAYLIDFSSAIIPVWIVQKIIIFSLFFCLGYLPFKYLPLPKNDLVRLFAALIYMANPFVYSRFLAGHWTHLAAYALLPVFIHFLFKFTFSKSQSFKLSIKLFAVLWLISLFSMHFFAMSVIIMAVWFSFFFFKNLLEKKRVILEDSFKSLVFCGLTFLIMSSYWIVPAMFRDKPVEQSFNVENWKVFSASGHGDLGVDLNILTLNGFWGEREVWSNYFAWPHEFLLFWIGLFIIAILILIGIVAGAKHKNKEIKTPAIFFIVLGSLAYIFSAGIGETVFRSINVWFLEHIFFWPGFRDSQKFVGLLALSYSFLAGIGLFCLTEHIKGKRKFYDFLPLILLTVPVYFGYLVLGGFQNQLQPVFYPAVWERSKQIIQNDDSKTHTLFLPWHGYFSLKFNNNLITANPSKRFFGENSIASRSIELGGLYDNETDEEYRKLDLAVRNEAFLSADETIDFFAKRNIKYIVYFQDIRSVDDLHYKFLESDGLEKIIDDEQLIMYKIKRL